MSVEDWLRPTDVEPPCGPNLEYDEQFLLLATAATGKPEQQYGATIIPAEDADWSVVQDLSVAVLGRTKDLRAAVTLTRALTHLRGLPGLAEGLELTRKLLDEHWGDVHPRLSLDGEDDPIVRANALTALADESGLVRDVRSATLLTTQVGVITVQQAESVLTQQPGVSLAMTDAQLRQAAAAALALHQAPIVALAAAIDHADAIQTQVNQKFATEDAPDLKPLLSVLKTVGRLVVSPAANSNGAASSGQAADAGGASGRPSTFGELRTRDDAIRTLDSVCEFLSRTEPSNPAPLMIQRAKRLIGMDFLAIMRDMAPESLGQVQAIAGLQTAETSTDGNS